MVVESVRVHMLSSRHVVILKETDRDRYLPIWIGPWEASAIAMKLQGLSPERPLTHDLFATALEELGVRVERVVISELADETFHARLVLEGAGRTVEIDARPSDALALAVRAGVPHLRRGRRSGAGRPGRRRRPRRRGGRDAGCRSSRPASRRRSAPGRVPGLRQLARRRSRRRGPTHQLRRAERVPEAAAPSPRRASARLVGRQARMLDRDAGRAGPVHPQVQPQSPEVAHGAQDDRGLRAGRGPGGPRIVRHADLDHGTPGRAQLDDQLGREERAVRFDPDVLERRRAGRACRRSRRRSPGARRRCGWPGGRRARRRSGRAGRRA